MAARVDPNHLQPGEMVDGWCVVKRIGGGSYGVVYEVEKGGQSFALKIARHPEGSGDHLQTDARMERERACLHQLRHPNIVRAWGSGRWPDPRSGLLYILLDLIDGYTWAQWAEATHPTAHEVVLLLEKVFSAVEHMHGGNVLHRDLSLRNVMVRKADNEPVIIDFSGADYAGADELTDGPLPPGTPRNRSPEALRFWNENRLNPAARYPFKTSDDIFALGADLYDVLTDATPTRRAKRAPLGSEWLAPASPFKATRGRVPERLSAFAMTLIDRDPGKRPTARDARRVVADLKQQNGVEWHTPIHPPAAQVPPALDAAPGVDVAGAFGGHVAAAPASPLVSHCWWGRTAWGGVLVLMALLTGVALLLWGGRQERAALSASPQAENPTSLMPQLPSTPSIQQEACPTVKPPENATTLTATAPEAQEPRKTSSRRGLTLREKCALAVGTAVWIKLGCSGVQPRPEPDVPCSKEAIKAMREILDWDTSGETDWKIIVDVKKGEGSPEDRNAVFTDGPVQGAMLEGHGAAPKGMLLDGHLWTSGDRIYGRYFQAHVPGKGTVPVCVELIDYPHLGMEKREGSKPGAAVGPKTWAAVATKRYQ